MAALMAMAIGSGVIAPAAAQDEPVVIDLAERNQSGVTGTATLTPDGDQVTVRIEVEGPVGNNPVNIMTGTCAEFDANPVYSLSSVDSNGVSESTVDASLADLLAEPHVINIHASPTNLGTIYACAEIVAEEAPANETPTATAASETATATATANEVEITLATANASGVSGSAVLTAVTDNTTEVVVQVSGVIGTNLAAIYPGTCDDLDLTAAYELNDLDESGAGTTTIDVSLASLLSGEYALLVSDPEIALGEGSGLACGEIVGSVGGTTSGPATGAGITTITGVSASTVGLFASAGVLLIAGGLLLRRRDAR
jgi:hypothetical protein